MPETMTAPPAAPSAPSAPSAPATPEIHVTAPAKDAGPASPPPKSGSAKGRMFEELRKKAGKDPEAKPEPKAQPKPEAKVEPEVEPEVQPEPGKGEVEPEKGKKQSPWRLVDEHKAARLKAETEFAEFRKNAIDPAKHKEVADKLADIEKRWKELDDHVKYVDYTRSSEFQEKYQKPYDEAWARHMAELNELTIEDPGTGESRPMKPQDLLELVNTPLQQARKLAEERFGSFADDVMDARKEIRALFDKQYNAIEDAKKNAAARMQEMSEQGKTAQAALQKELSTQWETANKQVLDDPKYGHLFKPMDGDEEGNKRLQSGYELADKAFTVNPNAPGLNAEQRADIVRLHSAVRNRAAAAGRLAYWLSQRDAQIADLKKQLSAFKEAQPGAGTTKPAEGEASPDNARGQVFGALRKLAH